MTNKRIILIISLLAIIAGLIGVFLIEREFQSDNSNTREAVTKKTDYNDKPSQKTQKPQTIKADLYSDSLYNLPLVSIAELSNITPSVKQKVYEILENSQGCYYLEQNPETKEIFIILLNPAEGTGDKYIRHNLQTAKIDSNGHVTYTNIGYNGQDGEIENAVVQSKTEDWIFDESVEPYRPLKHIVYDKKKKVLYSETWNYDESEPVKYEMKNSENNVISVMKESSTDASQYRQEHIFYNNEGHTVKSLVANYDGADIKWFTYYDAERPAESITIESGYDNGLKTTEKIYDNEYKLVKTLNANYKDGTRTNLQVFDSEGNEILDFENQ